MSMASGLARARYHAAYTQAVLAGQMAAQQTVPTPMTVEYGEGYREVVRDGVCGFAWVNIKPGNSPFANWLKEMGHARKDSYYGGVTIWISDYNQSMDRKEAHARAMVQSLKESLGIEKVYAMSRMD